VFVVGRLIERGAGDWTAAAEVLALREGLQRHIEASGKARKGVAANAEGGARGGCWWDGSDCAGTLTKQNAGGGQRMPDKDNLGAVLQPTAFRWQNERDGLQQDDAVATLRASAGSSGFHEMNHPVIAQPAAHAMTVRRLTPRECERLQGFPDDYTLIPWRKKQAEDCPDGPRYKALGNSMAVNCMAWIGERIAAYEATP
jgi:site-specific DNA-cytosine methylase